MNGIRFLAPFLLETGMKDVTEEVIQDGQQRSRVIQSQGELTSKALKDETNFGRTDFTILLERIRKSDRSNQEIRQHDPNQTGIEFSHEAVAAQRSDRVEGKETLTHLKDEFNLPTNLQLNMKTTLELN